jgi:signal peptidase I
VLVGVLLAWSIDRWWVTVARVDSESMAPTLRTGELVAITRPGGVSRGDVVAFEGRGVFVPLAHEPVTFLKRVVGVGGDRVTCCDARGELVVNGERLVEPYLAGGRTDDVAFDVIIPPETVWVMGDNRTRSTDSRAYIGASGGGFVPLDHIEGRVVAVVGPPSAARRVVAP